MRNENKVTRSFRADCAQYLRDPVGTFLPFYLPSLTEQHPRRANTDETSIVVDYNVLVHVTMIDTPCYARTFPGLK